MWALAVGQRGLTTPRPPLPVALSEPQPHRALAGRWELPGGKWGAGRRDWYSRWGRVCTSAMALCSLQLGHDRSSRVEEYLCQSLPYLRDTQATLRKAAVRFIGEPQPPGTLFWQPGPSPHHCAGSKGQPCGCQSPGCPKEGPVRRWARWEPCSVPLPSGTVLPWGQPC